MKMLTAILLALFIGIFILLLLIIFLGPSVNKGDIGTSCTVDSDCFAGLTCENSICKSRLDGICNSINDCVSTATSCFKNRCVGMPLGNVSDPAPCISGLIPEFNMCKVAANGVCNGNGDCINGLYCINSVCIPSNGIIPEIIQETPRISTTIFKKENPIASNRPQLTHPLEEERIRRLEEEKVVNDNNNSNVNANEGGINFFATENEIETDYTLVEMQPFQKGYKDLFTGFNLANITSATMFGKYIVATTSKGETRIYDAESNEFVKIIIKDKLHSVILVNGYITALTMDGQVVQYRHEVTHRDKNIEWVSVPLHIKARHISSSSDGRYFAFVTEDTCHIYDSNNEPMTLEKSIHYPESAKDIILGNSLKNYMIVTDKGLQLNGEKYIQASGGCFTQDGRFATIPLDADHIKKSYIFNEITYHIVDRKQLHKL